MSNHAKAGIAVGALAIAMYLAIRFVVPLFTPFIVALFIAILIDPVVSFMDRRLKMPRAVAVIIVLAALGVVFGLLVAVGVSEISREIDQLSRNIGGLSKSLAKAVDDLTMSAARFFEGLPQPVTDIIKANEGRIIALVQAAASAMAGFLGRLPQLTLTLLISIVATFFVSRDFYSASARAASAMPRAWRKQFGRIRGEMLAAFIGFLRARFVLLSITAVMTILGLSVMRVNYAWLLGLACGALDILPLVGPSALFLPWALYHILVGNVGFALGLVAVLALSSAVRQVAEARVMGRNLDLHPLVALISVYVGVQLFGVKGFIAGPLAVIFFKAILHSVILPMFPLDKE